VIETERVRALEMQPSSASQDMGYDSQLASQALVETDNDLVAALDWIEKKSREVSIVARFCLQLT